MLTRRALLAFLLAGALLWGLLPARRAQALSSNYVALQFRAYYQQHQGMRVLGVAQTGLIREQGYPVQYFEKGRIEDHRGDGASAEWAFMYGRLTAELMERAPERSVNGTSVTYGQLRQAGEQLQPPPPGFNGGVATIREGRFVPYHPQLQPGYGYVVPDYFWSYINRVDLFPGGWLHDIGLPMTGVQKVQAVKDGQQRWIMLQGFERAVLTYDPLNPPEWWVERGNIGSDAVQALGIAERATGPRRIEVDLSQQWLYAYEGEALVYDAPVSTGKPGWETPTGSFAIYLKYPRQTMRGRVSGESWEVPDVPHVMYFLRGGFALHGTYWHNRFGTGERRSHGCVNLPLEAAALLYDWAPIGTPVIVYD